ncbi:MAG: carboxylate--amine ligase [Marinobacter sp.]|nr:carboxylate--amine ligase [Marinobacter sp.]
MRSRLRRSFDRRYIVVAPNWAADFCAANKIPFIPWDFIRLNDRSHDLTERLKAEGVDVAIPLFEETVEWSGAINSVLLNNPHMYGQSILFRNKSLMKRRAQLGGIRVGIFEEAYEKDDIVRFMKRVNQTLLHLDGDPDDPIHVKAFDKAGCLGHRMIRKVEDIDAIPAEEYPLLMESHLNGWEFAVEAWIHDGEIKFLNISEYVTLGYSVFVPATKELESWRNAITKQIELLIKTFDIRFGFIHPEYFVTADGEMYFGEVAYRPPGFKAFELIERAYGFSAYQASMLVFDPKSTKEEVDAFFPPRSGRCEGLRRLLRCVSKTSSGQQAGNALRKRLNTPYFESHELVAPTEETVPERSAFGTHWGLVFFFGDDPIKMRDLLKAQEELDFYV